MDSQYTNLISKEFKEIENQIVNFYVKIGQILDQNKTLSKIFAYFKLYQRLTQDEIQVLTKFSSSTISTTLQLFLQLDILTKEMLPNQRKYVYQLKDDKVSFIYLTFSQIMADLEQIDLSTIKCQKEVLNFQNKYPKIVDYFILCLNGIRNYIEAQRRAINGKKKFPFFKENISKKGIPIDLINYPEEIQQIEEELINELIRGNYFSVINPIKNKIISYIITRQKFTQEMLMNLTDFSRSTVSRVINDYLDDGFIKMLPREYRKAQIYYQDSFSLAIINVILNSDYYIFSWIPKFQNLLNKLQSNVQFTYNEKKCEFLISRIEKILIQIEELKIGSKLLEKAKGELETFLEL